MISIEGMELAMRLAAEARRDDAKIVLNLLDRLERSKSYEEERAWYDSIERLNARVEALEEEEDVDND